MPPQATPLATLAERAAASAVQPCALRDRRSLSAEHEGTWWLGDPIDLVDAKVYWPDRPSDAAAFLTGTDADRKRAVAEAKRVIDLIMHDNIAMVPATAHFLGIRMEEVKEEGDAAANPNYNPNSPDDDTFDLRIGDYVLMDNEGRDSKAQVLELYAAADGSRRARVHWFYDAVETELAVKQSDGTATLGALEIDHRQLWRARDADNATYLCDFDTAVIIRPISVVKVEPDEEPPSDPDTYWYCEETDRRFYTFEAPLADVPAVKERWAGQDRVIRKMDVFCGAGGLGYMGEQELAGGRVKVVNTWAVDYESDMTATFKANFRGCHVITSGTDEWLALCQEVYDTYQELSPELKAVVDRDSSGAAGGSKNDDDKLIYPSKSLVLDKKKEAGAKKGGKKGADAAEAAADADAAAVETEESLEATEVLETTGVAEEVDEGAAVSAPEPKRAKGANGKKASGKGKKSKNKSAAASSAAPSDEDVGSEGEDYEVDVLLGVRLVESAPRSSGSGVDKGQLTDFIGKANRFLEFKVRWKNFAPEDDTWEPAKNLEGCPEKIAAFLHRLRRRKLVPFPGEVDLFVGGPPCQGVSGNNRHALTQNILKDPRNRQLLVFLAMVSWWRPAYVLMENIQDILKKESGAYLKYAMGQMISERYQTRCALLPAGNYGVAQGRWRVFVWAARHGEQLPAFPEPSHRCRNFSCAVVNTAKGLLAGFTSPEAASNAHPPVLLGDVLTDLPPVDNFELADRCDYTTSATTIPQAWLRRDPLPGATSCGDRDEFQAKFNAGGHALNVALREVMRTKGPLVLGTLYMNNKNCLKQSASAQGKRARPDGLPNGFFPYQCIHAGLKEILPDDTDVQETVFLQLEASQQSYAHSLGLRLHAKLEEYFRRCGAAGDLGRTRGPQGKLPDHRPLCCNSDDYLRLCGVAPRLSITDESSFRDLEGVVVHDKSSVACAGHSHVPRNDGKTACPGGGTHDRAAKNLRGRKEGRVDHAEAEGWRGVAVAGCPSFTTLMPTGDLLCPRWAITFKDGKCNGRTACFGRVHPMEVMRTVVGRAEPHNLRIGHPEQNRVLTIREMARCQGFPDHHVLCGEVSSGAKRWVRNSGLKQRYQQMGNAVSPAVAAALGRCLALAAVGESPPGMPVVAVPDPAYEKLVEKSRKKGIGFYYEGIENAEAVVPLLPARLTATWELDAAGAAGTTTAANGATVEESGEGDDDDEEEGVFMEDD